MAFPFLLALALLALSPRGAAAQSTNFGTYFWDRASSSLPTASRANHVAASDFATLVVSGGTTLGGARDGSSTVYVVTGAGGAAARATAVLPAAANGVGNLSLSSVVGAAAALVWDDAPGAPKTGDALLAYSGVGDAGAARAGLARMTLGATSAWTAMSSSGSNLARAYAAAVFLPRCNQTAAAAWTGCVAVHGGLDAAGAASSSLLVSYLPGAPAPQAFSDYPFSLVPNGAVFGTSRFGHSLVAHPDGTSAFMFGGTSAGVVSSDLYWLSASGFSSPLAAELLDIDVAAPTTGTPPDPIASANFSVVTDNIVGTTHNPASNAAQKATAGYNACFQTNSNGTTNPYVMVDLGAPSSFAAVQVFTRTDCSSVAGGIAGQIACLSAMQNYEIWVGSSALSYSAVGNSKCAGAASDFAGGLSYVLCVQTAARYVYLVLPGVLRVLTVCELNVLKAKPWTWRFLSSSNTEMASGVSAATASMSSGNVAMPGEAFRAIDGFKTNDFRTGSCASTSMTSGSAVAGAYQQWMVDLGSDYTLTSVTVSAAAFWDAAGTTNLYPNRTKDWYVYAGFSPTNALLNTRCGGPFTATVPASAAAAATSNTIACATGARYVHIRRYSGPADNDDTVAVCEVSVRASPIPNAPSGRTGHAATQFRGDMVIFGGVDANSRLLKDVHFFDMLTRAFLYNAPTPLGSPPFGRSGAALTVLGANLLAISGGSIGSDPTSLVELLTFLPCAPITALGGIASTYCTRDQTACQYTCSAGYVSNNPDTNGWIVCKRDGTYDGLPTPCSIVQSTVLGTPSATPSGTSIAVSWTKTGAPTHFLVQPVIDPAFEVFDQFTGSALRPLWTVNDPTGGLNKFSVNGGSLSIGAQPTCDCTPGNATANANCPFVWAANPANLDVNNYIVETNVILDPRTDAFSAYTAGIAIVDSATKLVQFQLGVANDPLTSRPRVEWTTIAAVSQQFNVQVDVPASSGGIYLRIERSSVRALGGWLASWRSFPNDAWTAIGTAATTANFFNPSAPAASMRAALVVRNSAGSVSSVPGFSTIKYADFAYFRLAGLACASLGRSSLVLAAATSTTLTGLSPGGRYVVSVAGSTDGGITYGTAAFSASVLMPAAAVVPAPVSLIEVARGQPAFSNPVALGTPVPWPASLANDGNTNTTSTSAGGLPQCFRSAAAALVAGTTSTVTPANGFRWTVDLGWDTDVHSVVIYNAANRPEFLSGFAVSVSAVADASADIACDMSSTPINLTSAPYAANVSCGLHGRYLTVSTPTDPFNAAFPQALQICEVQVFAPNSCPLRPAPANGVTVSGCGAGSPRNSECFQACNPGYKAISGDEYAACRGSSWDQPSLVCVPLCAEIVPQSNVESCTRTLIYDEFKGSAAAVQARWTPLDQRQTWGSFWFADGSAGLTPNTLQAAARLGCDSNMVIKTEMNDVKKLLGEFVVWAALSTQDQAGLAFRIQDIENYYLFGVDVLNQVLFCDIFVEGAATRLAQAHRPELRAGTQYQLTAQVRGTKIYLYFIALAELNPIACPFGSACEYGSQAFPYIVDDTFLGGDSGLYAASTAVFSWFEVDVGCDTCNGLGEGEICTFLCKAGNSYGTSTASRTCNATFSPNDGINFAGFDGSTVSCTPKAPIIRSEATSCFEGLPLDAPCGDPIDAILPSPTMEASYTIVSGNTNNAFYISSCTGQLIVANASAVFAEITATYSLSVAVRVTQTNAAGGTSTNTATGSVTVTIIPVPGAPSLASSQVLTVPENSPAGTSVGLIACSSSSATVVSVLSDGSQGRFVVAASGAVSVTASATTLASYPLDFEASIKSWLLNVRCALAIDSNKFAVTTVNVTLTDADDAPRVDVSTLIELSEVTVAANPPSGVGAQLQPLLSSITTDEDANPAFRTGVTYTLIAPSLMQTTCTNAALNVNVGSATPVVDARYAPTTTGFFNNGSALFVINPTTGALAVAAAPVLPSLPFASPLRPPTLFLGFVTLGDYQVCVSVADSGSPPRLQVVSIGIVANLVGRGVISGCSYPSIASVAGGESVTCAISGVPFSETIIATYTNGITAYTASCALSAATSSVTCITAPGTGSRHLWTFTVGSTGAFIAQTTQLNMRYAAPVVNSASGNAAALTAGGTQIGFTGLNLGSLGAVNSSAAPVIVVSVGTSLQYQCAFLPLLSSSTQIFCSMGAGAGANLPVQVLVSGQAYAPIGASFVPTITFAAPSITCVFVAGANCSAPGDATLATSGGTILIIEGVNFGPNTGEVVAASFGPSTGLEFTLTSCAHVASSPQTQIACTTPAATGSNLGLVVKVAGQASARSTGAGSLGVSFAAPAVAAVDGPGIVYGSTTGGQTIYIEGTGFGATTLPGAGTITVTYGPGTGATPRPYTATNCYVDQAPPTSSGRINCESAPGTGKMASWLVVIGGSPGLPFTFTAASPTVPQYGNPVIVAVQYPNPLAVPQGLSTGGGELLKIQGENLGPATAFTNSVLQVWFGVPGSTNPSIGFSPAAGACTVTVAHTQISCTTPAGSSAGMAIVLFVNGLSSTQPTLSYLAPVVTEVTLYPSGANLTKAPGDCNTPFQVLITGANFGPSPYFPFGAPGTGAAGLSNVSAELITGVTFGATGVEYAASSFTHQTPTTIIATVGVNDCGATGFSVATGLGSPLFFKVVAGNQAGGKPVPSFAYSRPLIGKVLPATASIGEAGPPTLTVTTTNAPFLDPLNALVIMLGNPPNVAVLTPNRVSTAAGLAQLQNADGSYNVTAALPLWYAGAGLAVRLGRQSVATGLVSPITDLASASKFSYQGPQISSVTVTLAPWLLQGNLSLCPFGAFPANPRFLCSLAASPTPVHQIVVSGSGFGALDRTQDAGVPASYTDGVVRELGVAVGAGNGTVFLAATTATAQLWFDNSRWSNSRLVAYATTLAGVLQVKLTSTGSAAAPQVAQAAFSDVSPAFGALLGATTNLPTAGGASATPWAVLNISYVNQLSNANSVSVNVGGRRCPLVVSVGGAWQYVTDSNTQVLTPARAAGVWSLTCVVPPGQGSRAAVSIVRTEAAGSAEFFAASTVSYAAPVVTDYYVMLFGTVDPPSCGKNGCGAAALDFAYTRFQAAAVKAIGGFGGAVLAPCAGAGTIRIRGSNLGAAPTITLADGYTVSGAAVVPCTDGVQLANTTCWEFPTPPGEGRGLNFVGGGGYQIQLCAGDQCGASANFGYQGALVTQIRRSTGTAPTNPRNNTVLTLLGRNFGVVNQGRDPGQSALTLRVGFAQPGQQPFAFCFNVKRFSDGNLTCTLPAGTGAGLDVRVFVQDTDGVTPASFSYDPPTISEVWVMALVPPPQPPVCVPQTTLDASGKLTTSTVCQPSPQQPPPIPDQSTFPNANVRMALSTDGAPGVRPPRCRAGGGGCPLYKLTGGQTATSNLLITGGSTLDSGNLVVIAGSNFGLAALNNCPAMPWTFRPDAGNYAFKCNNNEDFLGEGEVPADKILLWTDTVVAFFTNAGIGLKDFEVVAGGQVAVSKGVDDNKRIRFRYDTPQIFRSALGVVTGVLPSVFNGDGDVKQPVQLLASNLGPVPIDFSLPGKEIALMSGTNWFLKPVPLNCSAADVTAVCAPRLPTSYITVLVGRVCVARAFSVDGQREPATANCNGVLQSQTANSLTFVPPQGVGRNKQLFISVVDASAPISVVDPISTINAINAGLSPGQPGWFDYVNNDPPPLTRCCGFSFDQIAASGPVPFSFQSPSVQAVSPSLVRVGSALDVTAYPNVTIRGANLGNPTRVEEDMWVAADRALSVSVGPNVPCVTVSRSRIAGPAGFENVISCQVNVSAVGVGYQPLVISVAGVQTPPYSLTSNLLDLLVQCQSGFFGRTFGIGNGETCLPCPKQGAYCAGGFSYPRPLPGWYNMNSSDALTQATTDWFGADVPRIACPHSAFQGAAPYYATGSVTPDGSKVVFSNGFVVSSQRILDFCPDGSCYSFNALRPGSFQIVLPRDVCIVPCPIPGACRGWVGPQPGQLRETGTDNVCAAGYQSLPPYYSCGACAKGYYRMAQACRKCPEQPAVLFAGYLVLVIIAAASAWLASRAGLHLAVSTLGIDFMQEVAMLAYSKVAWTAENRSLFYVFSAFYLNQEIVAPECTVGGPVSFNAKFFFTMFMPIGFGILLGAVAFSTWFVKLVILRRRREERGRHMPLLLGACLSLWSLIYVYEVEMDMQVFNCAPLSPATYDAKGVVINFLSVQHEACSMKGGVWESLYFFAIAGFVVYVAGFPLGVASWLFYNREHIMEDQLLRAKGVGEDRVTGPHTYEMRKAFGGLYFQFKPDYYYWGVVVLVRKFALLGVILVAFNQSANYQMAAALLILVVFYALHVRLSPYMSPGQYDLVLRDHTMAALTNVTHARLRASIAAVESRGLRGSRHRNLVDFQGQIDRAAVLGVLRGWAFDYNSVVSMMLFGEIIIVLMGILVNIQNVDATYGGSSIAASVIISLVAAVIVLYFVVVLVADVLVVFAERSITVKRQAAQMAKRRQSRGGGKDLDGEEGGPKSERRASSRLSVTAESFVGAMTSEERRIQLETEAKQRKAEAVSGAPTETSVNPMFALRNAMEGGGGGPASPSKIALIKQEVRMSAMDPAELDSHLMALQGFGDAPPPPSLWPGVRDAAANAMRQQSNLMLEVQELKRALAEARENADGGGGGAARRSSSGAGLGGTGGYGDEGEDSGAGVLRVGSTGARRSSAGAGAGKRSAFKPQVL